MTDEIDGIIAKLTKDQCEAVVTGRAKTERDGLTLFRLGITRRDLRCRAKVYSDLGHRVRSRLSGSDMSNGKEPPHD